MKENPITTEATEQTAAEGSNLQTERYQITDMDGVKWYAKKQLQKDTQIAALRAELETVTANYRAMIEQIESDKRSLEHLYGEQVETLVRAETEGTRRKSVTTPYGILGFREVPGGLKLTDKQACADVALTLGLTATVPDLDAYKKRALEHFDKTGETLPGFEYKPKEERFAIRQAKPKESAGSLTEEGA